MVNLKTLDNMVENDSNVRSALYNYHKGSNPIYGGLTDYESRALFEKDMLDLKLRKVMIGMYAPQFDSDFPSYGSAVTPKPGKAVTTPTASSRSPYMQHALSTATTIGACSLAALVTSYFVDNPKVAEYMALAGKTGLVTTPLGVAIAYIKDKI